MEAGVGADGTSTYIHTVDTHAQRIAKTFSDARGRVHTHTHTHTYTTYSRVYGWLAEERQRC